SPWWTAPWACPTSRTAKTGPSLPYRCSTSPPTRRCRSRAITSAWTKLVNWQPRRRYPCRRAHRMSPRWTWVRCHPRPPCRPPASRLIRSIRRSPCPARPSPRLPMAAGSRTCSASWPTAPNRASSSGPRVHGMRGTNTAAPTAPGAPSPNARAGLIDDGPHSHPARCLTPEGCLTPWYAPLRTGVSESRRVSDTATAQKKPAAAGLLHGANRRGSAVYFHLALQVVLQPHLADQFDLRFQIVDVFFGVVQDVLEQVARHVVAHRLAMRDGVFHRGLRALLEPQVTGQDFRHVLADEQLVQVLQVGQAIQHQNTLDQAVGVLHFADRLFIFMLAQLFQAPVVQDAGMQKILVDGRQFVRELLVQKLNDRLVAFHDVLL